MLFTKLGLAPEIVKAVKEKGYETPTPIQERAIPIIMEEKDLIGCAQTGTGKTAGFTLPLLHRFRERKTHDVLALVLVPTRELAMQVYEAIKTYGRFLHLRTSVVFGGVGLDPQIRALRAGVNILVATPGRLLDHMRQGHVKFNHLEVLVIDEADRMLDMGFIPDIRVLMKNIPSKRQTLLFSATMPPEIRRLADEIMKEPQFIEVARQGTPAEGIRQVVYPVDSHKKRDLLLHLIKSENMTQVLVFTRTKRRADQVEDRLKRAGVKVVALHSDKSQSARTRALEDFRRGRIQVLVATNIAARGLDVKGVSHVVNYEIPDVPEDYVHRIGRTARAEATGDAISLMAPEEIGSIRMIEHLMGFKIARGQVEGITNPPPVSDRPMKRTFRPRRSRGGFRKLTPA
jgi:ATP-dependent RNA helicase RhlE